MALVLKTSEGASPPWVQNPTSSVLNYTYLETVKIVNSIILLHPQTNASRRTRELGDY